MGSRKKNRLRKKQSSSFVGSSAWPITKTDVLDGFVLIVNGIEDIISRVIDISVGLVIACSVVLLFYDTISTFVNPNISQIESNIQEASAHNRHLIELITKTNSSTDATLYGIFHVNLSDLGVNSLFFLINVNTFILKIAMYVPTMLAHILFGLGWRVVFLKIILSVLEFIGLVLCYVVVPLMT